jgi:hypothetical protein
MHVLEIDLFQIGMSYLGSRHSGNESSVLHDVRPPIIGCRRHSSEPGNHSLKTTVVADGCAARLSVIS